ncbi:hypothetical protein [Mycobacterium gallinarum]|uniref:hypothetical protein n=1 Tax=Mycobacterium gallinarum TaxID=39689 RepID=UPI001E4321BD|nr:hypothetical protein [Mycobacterium gallinarum]
MSRPVWVHTGRALPASGARMDELPLWVRSGGLLIEPRMLGRLVAWLRRSDGGWVAVVEVDVSSPNRRSCATATMWLPAGDVSPVDEQSA